MKSTLRTAMAAMAVLMAQPAWCETFPDIVVLGDEARQAVMQQCSQPCRAGANLVATPPPGSSASAVATLAQRAKHAVIVVDATQGPLPITREHVQIARQAGVPSLSMLFVNVAEVDDAELLELEEMEVREVMNVYEMQGDTSPVFHDAHLAAADLPKQSTRGLASVLEALADTPERTVPAPSLSSGQALQTFIYLLTPQESALTLRLQEGSPITLWVNGQVAQGKVTSTKALDPGDNGDLPIQLDTPVSAGAGSRFLLEREGRVIAMGVVASIAVGH